MRRSIYPAPFPAVAQRTYSCQILTVQSTQVGNVSSLRPAWSALGEMQQLLTNMCCNIRQQAGAKTEDAKCIQMRVEERNFRRQRWLQAEVALNKGYPTYFSLFSLPSPLLEHQATDAQERSWHFHVKESFVPTKPFAPAHRCTLHPATPMSKKQGTVHSNIYELPFVRVFGTLRQACLPIHLCFNT